MDLMVKNMGYLHGDQGFKTGGGRVSHWFLVTRFGGEVTPRHAPRIEAHSSGL